MRALEMALRVSGGVAHAMTVGVLCRSSERLWSVPESLRIRSTCARGTDADLPDDLVPFVRENLVTKSCSFPRALTRLIRACARSRTGHPFRRA